MYDLPSLMKLARKDLSLRSLISEEVSIEVAKESLRNNNLPKSDRIASVPSKEWTKTQVLCKVASSKPISDLIDSREFPQGSNELAVKVLKKAYPQRNGFTPLENHLIKVAQLCLIDDNISQEFGNQVHFQFFKKAMESKSDLWMDFLVVWEDSKPISKVAESIQTLQKEEAKTFRKLDNTKSQKVQKGESLKEKKKRDRKDNKMQKLTQIMSTFESAKDAKTQMGAITALKAQVPPSKKKKIVEFRRKWEEYKKNGGPFTSDKTNNEVKFDSLPPKQRKEIMKNKYLQKIFNLAKNSGGDGSKKEDKPKSDGDKSKSDSGDKSKSDSGDKSKSDSGGEELSLVESLQESQGISEAEAKEMAGNIVGEGEGDQDENKVEPDSSDEAEDVENLSETSTEAKTPPKDDRNVDWSKIDWL